jgi:APA family basic amino acid/polyamine antiporter
MSARELSGVQAIALVAGSMLGIGIFIGPKVVAEQVGTVFEFYAVWTLAAVFALAGAMSLAELGANMPRGGGEYPYLREAWGGSVAFSAGWLQLLAIFPGSLATVAVATATYQLPALLGDTFSQPIEFLSFAVPGSAVWGALLLVVLTAVNHLGVRISGHVQVAVTLVPLLVFFAIAIAVTAGLVVVPSPPPIATPASTVVGGGWRWAQAYLPAYFAFSGWNAAAYVGSEIRAPEKNLSRSLVWGCVIVAALYLLLCQCFVTVFGLAGLREVFEAGTATSVALFGPVGGKVITVTLLLAMLGTLNGTVLAGSRIAEVMAQRGDCFSWAASRSKTFGTPHAALWLQAAIALVLIALGQTVSALLDYTTSAMLVTGTLTVLAVVRLRRKALPGAWRYRMAFYPLPPILYAASSLAVLIGLWFTQGVHGVLVLLWLVVGMGVYGALRHNALARRRAADDACARNPQQEGQ